MNHHGLQELLSAYADGELDREQQTHVLTHLETCSSCRRTLQEIRQIRSGIVSSADIEFPYSFSSNVLRNSKVERESVLSWLGIEHSAERTFAVLALLVFLFLLFMSSGPAPTTAISLDQYMVLDNGDSAATQVLVKQEEISKQDVFYAVVSR
ncbi:MAG: zf-HC2 domain-containing protein [Bacteroidota bacterium]